MTNREPNHDSHSNAAAHSPKTPEIVLALESRRSALKPTEVALLLALDRKTIYSWCAAQRMPSVRLDPGLLAEWLIARSRTPVSDVPKPATRAVSGPIGRPTIIRILESRRAAMKPGEVEELLAIDVKTIYRWAARQLIPSLHIGHCLRFDAKSLADWLTPKMCKGSRSSLGVAV